MAAPEPQPRAVETPLPSFRADAPHDVELGVTTTEDGQWGTPTPARATTTRSDFGFALLFAGISKARYTVLKHGWHRKRL